MGRRNLAFCGLLASLLCLSPTAHADIAPLDLDELRRNGPTPSCPVGSDGSPLEDVECVPAAACTSSADCDRGDCAPRSLCLAAERNGVRPVLGVCVDGACPFGECETTRRCDGRPESSVARAQAGVERMLLEALDDPAEGPTLREDESPAPAPMANSNPEPPVRDPVPAAPPASSGCGCRVGPTDSPVSSLWLGLPLLSAARRRRSRGSRRRAEG